MANDLVNTTQVVPTMIGVMSTINGTAVGAPVNILGYQGAMGIAMAGAVQGSTGSTVTLTIKFQEAIDPLAIGTGWSDITNEAVTQGSFKFDSIILGDSIAGGTTTGTHIPYESVKKYCKLADGNRKQWIRAHATLTGTAGISPKIAVALLLERPVDTYYVSSAVVQPSGNTEFTRLLS